MSRRRLSVAALVLLVTVLAVAAAVGGYAVTDRLRHHPTPTPSAPTPRAYTAAGATPTAAPTGPSDSATAPAPSTAGVARALAPLLRAPGLGPEVRAQVLDATTGAGLFGRGPSAPAAPASTAKLLTAAAVLAVRPPTYRITTTLRRGPGGAIVLVGAGDPTLSGASAGSPTSYAQAARLSDFAAQLREANVTPTRILVDDSAFTGPLVSPKWAKDDVPSDYGAPITAAMVDGGRDTPTSYIRSSAPDLAAGHRLAGLLGRPDLPVARGRAPAGAPVLASVRSAPLSALIEQMLHQSDNVIAECLARQVALATHRPASFAGATTAVRAVLRGLGVDPGPGMADGSGLAASDRLSAATLTRVLRLAVTTARLRDVLSGLPVAAWSGTLANRYLKGSAKSGGGLVRAKTGTLTGVSALAGTVHDRSGRLLVFAFIADRAGSTPAAEQGLDGLAARLAACGCG